MEQHLERIAKALENTKDDASVSAYRSAIQASDLVDANSIANVPMYHTDERKSFVLEGRFSERSAVATVLIWRGYTPITNGATAGTFVARAVEAYTLTAAGSGGPVYAGKFSSDPVAFSALACRAFKVTLPFSVSSGTVDLYIRKLV
jgi:hypothetical protein